MRSVRAGHPSGRVLESGDRLDQALLIRIFLLVEAGEVQQGREEVDGEEAHHRTHYVHHQCDGNEGAQDAHDCCKHHEADIEVSKMIIFHSIYEKLQQSVSSHLEIAGEDSHSSKKVRNLNDEDSPFVKVTVQQSLLAIQSRNRKHSEYTDQLIH